MASPATVGVSNTENTGALREILPIREHEHNNDDEEGRWAKKTVLSLDGGGVRGYSSLLILKRIMERIRDIETSTQDGRVPVDSSKSYPWLRPDDGVEPTRSTVHIDRNRVDDFLPCHYFDYIAGTSTGGLSAIMLGRLRMSIDQALDEYAIFGSTVFGKPRLFHVFSIFWFPRSKFSSQRTQNAFKAVVCNKLHPAKDNETKYEREKRYSETDGELFMLPEYRRSQTKTLVFSHRMKKEEGHERTYMWRSYMYIPRGISDQPSHNSNEWKPLNGDSNLQAPIWQVACATSAAPRYFKPMTIGVSEHVDGGIHANNPSFHTLTEVKYQHDPYIPELFLSIGTGKKQENGGEHNGIPGHQNGHNHGEGVNGSKRNPRTTFSEFRRFTKSKSARKATFRGWIEIGRHAVNDLTDKARTHNTFLAHCDAMGLRNRYRLDVSGDMSKIPLDEWLPRDTGRHTLEKLTEKTNRYLDQPYVREQIDQIAQCLVRVRRERAETEYWEAFALNLVYLCPSDQCQRGRTYGTRNELRLHVRNSPRHAETRNWEEHELEAFLDRGRRQNENGRFQRTPTTLRQNTLNETGS